MPARYLNEPADAAKMTVIGQYADNSKIVRHLGMLAAAGAVELDASVDVFESGPPLRIGQESDGGVGTMEASVVGWVDDLRPDELEGMEMWLETTRPFVMKGKLENYVIHPPAREEKDTTTGRRIGVKFSCVGLVERCYAEGANICLLTDLHNLPAAPRELLLQAWAAANHPLLLAKLGIDGDGPWRVLLPGYLLNALKQPDPRQHPYTPTLADAALV